MSKMNEMEIEKAMVIDDVECVRKALERLSGKKIRDIQIIRKFINSEKHTKFFIDKKMKSSVNHDTDNTYVWLDTGFCDRNNKPLFISLLNDGNGYAGHHVGAACDLMNNIKAYFPKNKKEISANFSRFQSKYNQKCVERENPHIEDENTYCLCKLNSESDGPSEFAKKLNQLNVAWEPDVEEEFVEETVVIEPEVFNKKEEEITIGLLLEMLEEREQYIQELLTNLQSNELKKNVEIQELVDVIKEQSVVIKDRTDALNRMRNFNEDEEKLQLHRDMKKKEKQKGQFGHKLLDSHKKIIVVGDVKLTPEVMKGIITKEYGFEENDFEYELDYNKVVHSSGRIINSSRYQAIIFGCCPHSAMGKGKWNSLIERCKQSEDMAFIVDARNEAGNLKVTKGSFRKAMSVVCDAFLKAA